MDGGKEFISFIFGLLGERSEPILVNSMHIPPKLKALRGAQAVHVTYNHICRSIDTQPVNI